MVVSQKKLLKVAVKHDGNLTHAGKELGISHQALSKRIKKNPEIKKAILNVREAALQKAGLSRTVVYKRIREGLDAKIPIPTKDGNLKKSNMPDMKERREYAKIALLLHKDLDPDKEQSTNTVANIILNLIQNVHRETIQVV